MSKYFYPLLLLLLVGCTEPAFRFANKEQLDTLLRFPTEVQGVYVKGEDTLIVMKSDYYIKQKSMDYLLLDSYGELDHEQFLEKRGEYYVFYTPYIKDVGTEYLRMRFFSLSGPVLSVRKIKEDDATIKQIVGMAKEYTVEEDSTLDAETYLFTIDGKTLDRLMAEHLEEEMQLFKVK